MYPIGIICIVIIIFSTLADIRCMTLLDKSESFIAYDEWNASAIARLQFRFKTNCLYCLLLYADDGRTHKNSSNFFQLTILRGKLQLTVQMGQPSATKRKVLDIGEELNDLKWHSVEIRRNYRFTSLRVDTEEKGLLINGIGTQIMRINSYLFVGGIPRIFQHTIVNKPLVYTPRFVGCIEDIEYSDSGKPMRKASIILSKKAEKGCLNPCTSSSCANGGKCLNWFDRIACDCRGTGFEGNNCTTPSESMYLGGSEYIALRIGSSQLRTTDEIRFRFKSKRADALFLTAGIKGHSLVIELWKGYIRVFINLGAEPLELIVGNGAAHDRRWHSFRMIHKKRSVIVSLDNEYIVNGTIPSSYVISNSQDDPIYVGGHLYPNVVEDSLSRMNFIGCLQQFYFNGINVVYKVINTHSERVSKKGSISKGCPVETPEYAYQYATPGPRLPRLTTPLPSLSSTSTASADLRRKERQQNSQSTHKPIPEMSDPANKGRKKGVTTIITGDEGSKKKKKSNVAWITSGIVSGTIFVLITTACVVHYFRQRYRGVFLTTLEVKERPSQNGNAYPLSPALRRTDVIDMSPRQTTVYIAPEPKGMKEIKL